MRVDSICGMSPIYSAYMQMVSYDILYDILGRGHSSEYGEHYGAFCTNAKVWQCGFFWPTMYQDAKDFVRRCPRCQKHGNISTRHAMPLTTNLQVEIFDVWGIDYMGHFPMWGNCEYILVAVDYVSKWVEALPCHIAAAQSSKKMFHDIIFPRFGVPKVVISDGGSHFTNGNLKKYWKTQ
jgi:hypothetical protein